ncbi:hypothetical protein MSMEI_1816 [Mycolicibacterium smegmatis MC2 155]|uniref:Uncharacterized protein n=1 Tax=Mycolicibacterium smegmatis (strain ATCC 700084 / mc(2)155) TaxID=246196 RepID=I7FHK0_MYCS2|nr:hypothetical protein MSMEI_1816 [Mycolicibacterium smegmatis MC2 155]
MLVAQRPPQQITQGVTEHRKTEQRQGTHRADGGRHELSAHDRVPASTVADTCDEQTATQQSRAYHDGRGPPAEVRAKGNQRGKNGHQPPELRGRHAAVAVLDFHHLAQWSIGVVVGVFRQIPRFVSPQADHAPADHQVRGADEGIEHRDDHHDRNQPHNGVPAAERQPHNRQPTGAEIADPVEASFGCRGSASHADHQTRRPEHHRTRQQHDRPHRKHDGAVLGVNRHGGTACSGSVLFQSL